ncbi:MAG TPA: hypothetical protein VD866_26800 [Urbifossiella sp.]|nr:hypothetical protein [Urbifossiella sp.]
MTAALLLMRNWWPLGLCLLAFAAGWTVNGWRWEARHAAAVQHQLDDRVKAEQDANAKSTELESHLAAIRSTNRDLNRRLAYETAKPDYRCAVPPDGVRLLRDALSGRPAGQPDRPLP